MVRWLMTDPLALAVATFLFTVFGTAITTTWRVSRMIEERDSKLIAMMSNHELSDTERFAAVRQEVASRSDELRHEFGETGAAIREKMHEMEMWGRDNNLQKGSFKIVTDEIKESIKTISTKLDNQTDRNTRVDRRREGN